MGETLRIVRVGFALAVGWVSVHEVTTLAGAVDNVLWSAKWIHLMPMAFAVVACWAGGRERPDERLGWALLGGGIAAWTLGDTWFVANYWTDPAPPMPSPADAGYLLAPVLFFAGVARLWWSRRAGVTTERTLDGVAAALAVAATSCMLVVGPVARTASGDALSTAVLLAYPLLDIVVLGSAVASMAAAGWQRDARMTALTFGLLAFWAADASFLVKMSGGTYMAGDPMDVGWYAGVLAIAAAPWLPTRSSRNAPDRTAGRVATLVPLLFGALNGVVLIASISGAGGRTASAFALAGLVAVLARLGLTLVAHERLLAASERDACTDTLTGLPNRRALERDLASACDAAQSGRAAALAYFDLDGFKRYNDTFGHSAGDALLANLGRSLVDDLARAGAAYRLGGDEFCVLVHGDRLMAEGAERIAQRASTVLSARRDEVVVTSSYGVISLPTDAVRPAEALALADARMYARKRAARIA